MADGRYYLQTAAHGYEIVEMDERGWKELCIRKFVRRCVVWGGGGLVISPVQKWESIERVSCVLFLQRRSFSVDRAAVLSRLASSVGGVHCNEDTVHNP